MRVDAISQQFLSMQKIFIGKLRSQDLLFHLNLTCKNALCKTKTYLTLDHYLLARIQIKETSQKSEKLILTHSELLTAANSMTTFNLHLWALSWRIIQSIRKAYFGLKPNKCKSRMMMLSTKSEFGLFQTRNKSSEMKSSLWSRIILFQW